MTKRCGCPRDQWHKCEHVWTVRWWAEGKQREHSFDCVDLAEAKKFSLRVEVAKLGDIPAPHITKKLRRANVSRRLLAQLMEAQAELETPVEPASGPIPGWVYFIQGVDGGPIKIGFAADVASRLADLQVSNPYELRVLLAVASDSPLRLEKVVHGRFKAHHLRGEWFRPDQEILDYIKNRRED